VALFCSHERRIPAWENNGNALYSANCGRVSRESLSAFGPPRHQVDQLREKRELTDAQARRLLSAIGAVQAAENCYWENWRTMMANARAARLYGGQGGAVGSTGRSGVLLTPGIGRGYAYDTGTGLLLYPQPGGGTGAIIDLRGGGE